MAITPTTPQATIISMHTATWARRPAILVIEDSVAYVWQDDAIAAFVHVNDRALWATLVEGHEADRDGVVFIQDGTVLRTTIDGGYALARKGIRLFHRGEQLHP